MAIWTQWVGSSTGPTSKAGCVNCVTCSESCGKDAESAMTPTSNGILGARALSDEPSRIDAHLLADQVNAR
jgi:hypothetical protein